MTFYFFTQAEPKTVWVPALASERASILRDKKPALCTVLDVDNTFEDIEMKPEERASVKYRGPCYWDIDSENLDAALEQAKKLLTLFKSKGVDINSLRCYLSGGRGVHVLMDQSMFMTKIPAQGVPFLPAIYKEMVWSTAYVDDVDMRVYSMSRGRMLRCANYQRENKLYKVSVTADELMDMTVDRYKEFCSSPRNEMPVNQPKFNPEFGLAFSLAQDKVSKSTTKRKARRGQVDGLKKFGGSWPETLQLVISGIGLRDDVGFNQVAMQVAITGNALGKNEDEILNDCEGLIQAHKGDSDRYGSPSKRKRFLREMIRYTLDSPLYEYSAGGIINLLIPEIRANADISFGDWQPPPPEVKQEQVKTVQPDGTVVEETVYLEDEVEDAGDGPIRLDRTGIWIRGDEGYKSVCQLGLTKAVSMRRLDSTHIGYEVEVTLDNQSLGRKLLPMLAFTSKSQFNGWALTLGSAMKASDVATSSLADIFRTKAKARGEPVYAVEREGVDIVVPPGTTDHNKLDIIWSAPDGVVSHGKTKYRFHGHHGSTAQFKTDLMMAQDLSEADTGFFDDLFTINSPQNLAKMLGWFSAAFLTQIIRKKFGKFPIMQVFGQAEAGKSHTIKLLANMHYYLNTPKTFSVVGATPFPIIAATASSASIPVIFEEMKPRQMNKSIKDLVQSIFRSNYTADMLSRGSLGRDTAVRELTVTEYSNAAPIAFVGEAIEDQSAILARCVVVALSKADRSGRRTQFERCIKSPYVMGKLGKQMALSALAIDAEELSKIVQTNLDMLADKLPAGQADETIRALFNLAVTLTGLEFMRVNLNKVFGTRYDETIGSMSTALIENLASNLIKNMAEASRVLDTMSQMSRYNDPRLKLIEGEDYTLSVDGKTMDLKLRTAFHKYVKYQRDIGMEVLFDTESAFVSGMSNYGGTVQRSCPDNHYLYDSPKAVIFRLNLAYLDKEGVDAFKG